MNAQEALKKYFDHDSFMEGQEEIIEAIMSGRNCLAIMATGAGKSICYQIPALISNGFSIVVSPLISLMKDQVDSLNLRGHIAGSINSSGSFYEYRATMEGIRQGKIKLLYLSPEKLESRKFAEELRTLKPKMLFVDEAHCISQWGHSFRPGYGKIAAFARASGIGQISGFTATATKEVIKDIVNGLEMKEPEIFLRSFERKNIRLSVTRTSHKAEKLCGILKESQGSAIVYCSTRNNAEDVRNFLRNMGLNAEFYHAGLSPEARRFIQDEFSGGALRTMVATNAFGMGIDKSDIRTVVHYDSPGSIESYYQEIGRAGRDGAGAVAHLLFDERDLRIQKYLIMNQRPQEGIRLSIAEKRTQEIVGMKKLGLMRDYALCSGCRTKFILEYFGQEYSSNECNHCDNCLNTEPEQSDENKEESGQYQMHIGLYNRLIKKRKELSIKFFQPPELICPDEVLREISKLLPVTAADLKNINGLNDRVLAKAGADFLAIIKEFRK